MKVFTRAAFLLAPLLVMTALPVSTLAHCIGVHVAVVHPKSCYHGHFSKESGTPVQDAKMDCSECGDCCSGHEITAEPTTLIEADLVLKRPATNEILTSLTSLAFTAPEHHPKLLV